MLGMNHGPDEDPLDILKERTLGAISVYAQGDDYHDLIKSRLKAVARWLVANAGGDVKVFVDTAAVMEKPLAASAGLGWQGKHTNLVSRQHGSWLFRAIFTTLRFVPDEPELICGTCRASRYLPDGRVPGALPARCAALHFVPHSEPQGPIPRELRPLMGTAFTAATLPQRVPVNKFAQAGARGKLSARGTLRAPSLSELARLDDAAFRAVYQVAS